jgi:CDP-2,3-bis-(O-geranylgeranyl)-sn-glycerol synthase
LEFIVYILDSLSKSFLFYLPVFVANPLIYVVYSVIGLGIPLDLYEKIGDKRMIGPGRNVSGFFFYTFIALFVGILQNRPLEALYLGLGGIFGCYLSSFIKRRIGLKRGQYGFFIDQTDFIIGSTIFYVSFFELKINTFIFGIIIALVLHHATNLLRNTWEKFVKKKKV